MVNILQNTCNRRPNEHQCNFKLDIRIFKHINVIKISAVLIDVDMSLKDRWDMVHHPFDLQTFHLCGKSYWDVVANSQSEVMACKLSW